MDIYQINEVEDGRRMEMKSTWRVRRVPSGKRGEKSSKSFQLDIPLQREWDALFGSLSDSWPQFSTIEITRLHPQPRFRSAAGMEMRLQWQHREQSSQSKMMTTRSKKRRFSRSAWHLSITFFPLPTLFILQWILECAPSTQTRWSAINHLENRFLKTLMCEIRLENVDVHRCSFYFTPCRHVMCFSYYRLHQILFFSMFQSLYSLCIDELCLLASSTIPFIFCSVRLTRNRIVVWYRRVETNDDDGGNFVWRTQKKNLVVFNQFPLFSLSSQVANKKYCAIEFHIIEHRHTPE